MGAALRDIKRKITAVKKTRQITRAMNMVSAVKLRSAQTKMEKFRPYAEKLQEVLSSLAPRVENDAHPLLAVREPKRVRILLFTSDKGLCGAFNSNVIRAAERLIKEKKQEGKELSIVNVGRKGRDFFRRTVTIAGQHVDVFRAFDMELAHQIDSDVIPPFIADEYDELYIVYNEFRNLAVQRPRVERILPLQNIAEADVEPGGKIEYLYEPSEKEVLEKIIPMYIRIQIYRALLETSAGEHGARMVSMDNATKNCSELVERLTLQYNKARQEAITKEIIDIVGGTEALKQG